MSFKITVTGSFVRACALLDLFVFIPAFCILGEVRDRSWAYSTPYYIVSVLAVISTMFAVIYLEGPPDGESAENMRKPAYRMWGALGHPAIAITIGVMMGVLFTVMKFLSDGKVPQGRPKEIDFDLLRSGATYLVLAGAVALTGAFRFRRNNAVYFPSKPGGVEVAERFRAYGHKAHIVSYVCMALFTVLHFGFYGVENGPLQAVQFMLMLVCIASLMAVSKHAMYLCEQCAADFRTDSPEIAERRKWVLWTHHRVAVWFVPVMLLGSLLMLPFWSGARSNVSLILLLMNVLPLPVFNFHGKFQPWCPYCRRGGGGGGGENVEVPDPTPGHGKPIPV